jgi:hypothetical protein
VKGIGKGAINLYDGGAADNVFEGHEKSGWQISGKLLGRKVKNGRTENCLPVPG